MNQESQLDVSWIMSAFIATGLAKSICTISAPDGTIGVTGTPSGAYVDVAGLVGIPCMDAPLEFKSKVSATEIKALSETVSIEFRHVLMTGYFPLLAQRKNWGDVGWRATITYDPVGQSYSVTYDILGAESDSQSLMTRMKLQKVSI